jgi:hypothetical protein
MSLDESELLETKKEYIYFLVKVEDSIVRYKYEYDEFIALSKNCDFCKQIISKNYKKQNDIDLTKFKYDSFKLIISYLKTNIYPTLTKETDVDDLNSLTKYLSINNDFIKYTNFNTDERFMESLNNLDYKLIEDELKLRTELYKNEQKDFRFLDNDYEINKVINDLKLPEIKESKQERGRPYKNYNKLLQTEDYIGVKSVGYKREETIVHSLKYSNKIDPIQIINSFSKKEIFRNTYMKIINDFYVTLLTLFDYKNYVVAGGFIYRNFEFYESLVSDIDIFLTTKNYNEAIAAIKSIHKSVVGATDEYKREINMDEGVLISLNGNTINFTITMAYLRTQVGYHYYTINIQVILRLYNSIAQVISGFDIDSCCIAYDGKKFYCMPRFSRAIKLGYNIADPERQSTTYAQRLTKYRNRGFDIAIPGFIDTNITCNFLKNFREYKGLAKILSYTFNLRNFQNKEKSSDYEFAPFVLNKDGIYKILRKAAMNHYKTQTKDETKIQDFNIELNYTFYEDFIRGIDIFDPNGDNKFLFDYLKENKIKVPIKASYYLNYILDSKKYRLSLEDISDTFESSLPDKLQFKTENAGTQLTNSFQPLSEKWYDGLYLN